MSDLNAKEQAVLEVIRAAGKPIKHRAICAAIENPWYDRKSSYHASVSSTLGSLRSKGLIAPVEVRQARSIHGQGRLVRPVARSWFATPVGMGFSKGGVVGTFPRRIIGDECQHHHYPWQANAIERIVPTSKIVVSMRAGRGRPFTDDMKQMLDDLGIKPPPDYAEYAARIRREIARSFGIPKDLF